MFCEKCISKIKLTTSFKKSALESEKYLESFLVKINKEFSSSLPTVASKKNDQPSEDSDVEQMLLEEEQKQVAPEPVPCQVVSQTKQSPQTRKKPAVIKIEVAREEQEEEIKDPTETETATLYTEEEQLDEDGNMFDEEIYDIMEIDQDEGENIYEAAKQGMSEDDGQHFIFVNYKSSEDLQEKEIYVNGQEYSEESKEQKKALLRKKHTRRMPREIVEKYAQTTEDNQHVCTKCVKVFSTRTNLIRHIQSHDGNKAYVCELCNKGFTQSGSLKQHMYIHTGERPYKCQFCTREFTQAKTLKFHIRRHTEEKPFACSECENSFRQRDGLKRHLKSKHNIELKYERHNHLNDKIVAMVKEDEEDADSDTGTKKVALTSL